MALEAHVLDLANIAEALLSIISYPSCFFSSCGCNDDFYGELLQAMY